MRFSGEVQHRINRFFFKEIFQEQAVANIAFDEAVVWVRFHIGEIFQVARVSEFVEIDDSIRMVLKHIAHEVASDEACAAGYEKCFHCD
jgi:hypothetical protein